jgi:hypothetical protein
MWGPRRRDICEYEFRPSPAEAGGETARRDRSLDDGEESRTVTVLSTNLASSKPSLTSSTSEPDGHRDEHRGMIERKGGVGEPELPAAV